MNLPRFKTVKFKVNDPTQGMARLEISLEPPKHYSFKDMTRNRNGDVKITYELIQSKKERR